MSVSLTLTYPRKHLRLKLQPHRGRWGIAQPRCGRVTASPQVTDTVHMALTDEHREGEEASVLSSSYATFSVMPFDIIC